MVNAILSLKPDLQACAEDGRRKEPLESGKVVVDFTIAPDGSVVEIEAVSKSTAETVFAKCIVRIVLPRLRFAPRPQSSRVRFPFRF